MITVTLPPNQIRQPGLFMNRLGKTAKWKFSWSKSRWISRCYSCNVIILIWN